MSLKTTRAMTRQNVTVILCRGYNEQQLTQEFVGKELAGFLHKPYTLQDLTTELQEVLG